MWMGFTRTPQIPVGYCYMRAYIRYSLIIPMRIGVKSHEMTWVGFTNTQ